MKSALLKTCSFIILLAASLPAAPVLPPIENITDLRPVGEIRLWTLITRDSTLGTLESVVKEQATIDGTDGYRIESHLSLDLNKIGTSQTMDITDRWVLSENGSFLGCETEADISGRSVRLSLERDGDKLIGETVSGERKAEQIHAYPSGKFAVNSFFLDQLELFFASRELKVGNSFDEEIFVPMDMLTARVVGQITEFSWQRLHSSMIDSVFVIQLTQPRKMELFFTRDRFLRKVNYPNHQMRAYLDLIQAPKVSAASAKTNTRTMAKPPLKPIQRLPYWFCYLLIGIISLALFIGRGYRQALTYLTFGAGGILFFLTVFTLMPYQQFLVRTLVVPAIQAGESLFAAALMPALVLGLGHELLKLAGLFVLRKSHGISSYMLPVIGAALGAGFGLFEAFYISGNLPAQLMGSWNLMERGFLILFHTLSGVLLGWALNQAVSILIIVTGVLVIINSLYKYLPILIQQQLVTVEAMHLIIASITVLSLLFTMLLLKNQKHS